MKIERTQVLWLGPNPPAATVREFEKRQLTLKVASEPLSDSDFAVSCAVLFRFDSKRKGDSIGLVQRYAARAIDHGLLVVLCASNDQEVKLLQGHLLGLPDQCIRYSFSRPAYEIAELVARHHSGPALNATLEIKGPSPEPGDAFLLRRAFNDCRSITIEFLTKGRSGARVFVVYAEFPEGEAGPYPLPFFAKVDLRDRILKEQDAYGRFVTHYIPFSQRPNCEPGRCLVGVKEGILVGDFVDNSVPLSALVKPTGARSEIHSLFDDALRGWRQQAYFHNNRVALRDVRPGIFDPARTNAAHVARAKIFGATKSPDELASLLDETATHKYRRGPVHGDLNPENVRVRNGEAILIDFYKSDIGPLVADLASLEIAICFTMEAEADWDPDSQGRYADSERFLDWRKHIDKLFVFVAGEFGNVPPLQEQPSDYTWMWSTCRQLRLMAHYIESNERAYGYLLAAYMLRMSVFMDDPSDTKPEAVVRSYAYWVAERILLSISSAAVAA